MSKICWIHEWGQWGKNWTQQNGKAGSKEGTRHWGIYSDWKKESCNKMAKLDTKLLHVPHDSQTIACRAVFFWMSGFVAYQFCTVNINVYKIWALTNQIRSDQSLSCVRLFATPWITARQASVSITNSQSSLKLTSIESVMPSSHLILCCPLLLLPPTPPSIRVFSNESTLHMRWGTQNE